MALFQRVMSALTGREPLDQDQIDRYASFDETRLASYLLAEEYYSGFDDASRDHAGRLTDRARKYLERSGLPFNENFCETVIDVLAERLTVTGFTAEDKDADQSAPEDDATAGSLDDLVAWEESVWAKNRMDEKQGTVHTQALLKGDAYVIVDWDAERAIPRLSYNRPEAIPNCVYDEENADHVAWASKLWNTASLSASNPKGATVTRLNVYFPDRVEKYFRLSKEGAGGWERFRQEEADPWPTPWLRLDGSPRGVPVFHFRHKPLGRDYGRSELRGVYSFQDELNKLVIDLNEVMDYMGAPQRWASGVPPSTTFVSLPGTVMNVENPEATFGQFDPANPAGPLAAIEGCLSRMARRSRTPMHQMTGGTPPTGEALKTANVGLVSKAKKASVSWGNVWEDVMTMGLKLAIDAGAAPVAVDEENLVLSTVWEDPETRNDLAEAQTAEILDSLGVSKHTIHARLGLNYEEEQAWRRREAETLAEVTGLLLEGGVGASTAPAAEARAGSNGEVPGAVLP